MAKTYIDTAEIEMWENSVSAVNIQGRDDQERTNNKEDQ